MPAAALTRGTALLAWYDGSHRDLPWRHTTDPYHLLVSEVMLQQTQAERVVDHYQRFLTAFPTVESLAAAPLADVLSVWSGLGYNSRASRLREAARIIVTDGWPTTAAGLQGLPGVGPYTAAAVASFAFGESIAAVDTNVRRVLSRWVGQPLDGATLHQQATDEMVEPASTWNQAMMELGATVCRPAPQCAQCPVESWCTDPSVYKPPPRQSTFVGSHRQVRGAVLRQLGSSWMATHELTKRTGFPTDKVEAAIESLTQDGLVEISGQRARIVE